MSEESNHNPVDNNNHTPPRGGPRRPKKKHVRFPFELKLKAVKLYLEEGFSGSLISEETGASPQAISGWVKLYQQQGEAGLKGHTPPPPRQPKIPPAVTEKIVELKKENPSFGVKTISQWLRRTLFLQASPETVRQKLHQANLIEAKPPPKQKNITRPRFFERATPNQMWQSDIFTFRLGGRYSYLIAFMDDYSRFLVGADLFRSPTAEAVIEVYRQAVAEFKPPKEMLTDNGRQYTSWRGTSRFEAELKKDGVAHFRSRPQHPMTLGKIERFWETIWQNFLCRAQFESFDSARERIKLWIKYYNHKRPHQGIDGLCPADRFFEIQSQLRKTIEAGIQENLLEMALRGQPRAPFYMVGRMEGQSVVLRAEKGKLKLEVGDQQQTKELTYDLHKKGTEPDEQPATQNQGAQTPATSELLRPGESPGHPGSLDGEVPPGRCLPPTAGQLHDLPPLAEPGHGGNAPGTGEPGQPLQGRSLEPEVATAPPQAATDPGLEQADGAPGANPACQAEPSSGTRLLNEPLADKGGPHPAGPLRTTDGHGSGPADGPFPPALLPVGEKSPPGHAPGTGGSAQGTPLPEPPRPGEALPQTQSQGVGETTPPLSTEGEAARPAG